MWLLVVMIAGVVAGIIVLFMISGELARRIGISPAGRILLSAALGTGVIAVFIKVFVVGILMASINGHDHAPPQPVSARLESTPDGYLESSFTGKWHALPATAPTPDGQPLRLDVIRLGQRLFSEPALSVDGKVSCASCHVLSQGGDDNAPSSAGIEGLRGNRNAPTVWNAAFLSRLFWDGRASSLEDQAKGPLVNPVEMGMPSHDAVEAVLRAMPAYVENFARVFGSREAVTIENIAHAIASYERTLITPDTAYDRFVRGDADALSARQIRGMALFAGLGCRSCHRDPTFSGAGQIRPAGVRKPFPIFTDVAYVGKYDLMTDRGSARVGDGPTPGLWRVPPLRNVANTAPYFHNGSVDSLEEAVRVMAATQLGRSVGDGRTNDESEVVWDPVKRTVTPYYPSVLTEEDVSALAAFLESLSISADAGSRRGSVAAFPEPAPQRLLWVHQP